MGGFTKPHMARGQADFASVCWFGMQFGNDCGGLSPSHRLALFFFLAALTYLHLKRNAIYDAAGWSKKTPHFLRFQLEVCSIQVLF